MQKECFAEELCLLHKGQPVSGSSRLRQLCPTVDDQGVMRVEGRLSKAANSDVPYSAKHPVILYPTHRYTRLLLHEYHVQSGHQGHARTLNELRQRY